MDYKLGWLKDIFDDRDYIHPVKVVKIPDIVDLSQFRPDVRKQGNVGSCVGFGVGANVGSVAKQGGFFTEWYSPTWIYNGARIIEGTLNQDAGAYPRDALDWLVDNGCLLEQFWKYNPNKLDKNPPTDEQKAVAIRYPNFAYYRVDNGLNGILSALAEGHFVSIGAAWFDKWFYPSADGTLGNVSIYDSIAGGHETCLYGYDKVNGVLLGMKSWATDCRYQGLFKMPFQAIDVFKQGWGYDAHYIVFDPSPEPPPPPPVEMYTLSIGIDGKGSVSTIPNGPEYEEGTEVLVSAIPADGWEFMHWDGDLWTGDNPDMIAMDSDKDITAVFDYILEPEPNPNWFVALISKIVNWLRGLFNWD